MKLKRSDILPASIKWNKYHAKKTIVDGITFASKREAERYWQLKLMERAGEITGLELQVPYTFFVGDKPVFKYISDFRYFDRLGKRIIEDAKGFKTPVYRLKIKLLRAQYGIEVKEV